MGGFGLEYVAASEQVLFVCDSADFGGGLPGFPTFYRVDDDRQLLVWTNPSADGRVRACVIDASAAPALTVGAVVEFQTDIFSDIVAVQLDADNWLMYYLKGWQRFSISGTTITADEYEEHAFAWDQGTGTIPEEFYEGHVWEVVETNVTYSFVASATASGIDIDHIVVEAQLQWFTSGSWHTEPKIAILDLTTALPVASYNAAALGYTPGNDAAFGRPPGLPAYAEPGISYRVGVDGSANPLAVLIEATSSTTLAATITDLPTSFIADNGALPPFSRSPDGTLWTWFGERTLQTWTTADPVRGHYTMYSIVGATSTEHTYSFENFASAGGLNTVPSGPDGLMIGGYSWLTTDTHMRMDRPDLITNSPHPQTVSNPTAVLGGTPVEGYVLRAHQAGSSPATAYVALFKETPLVPQAHFTFDPKVVSVAGSPVTFDGTPTQALDDTDYYWHPIVGWHWEYDDGRTSDKTTPVSTHVYRRKSATHVAGSQIEDEPSPAPAHWGSTGYYIPVLIVTDTLGVDSLPASGSWLHDFFEDRVQVLANAFIEPVRQRQIPGQVRQRQTGMLVRQRQIPR
jgi:hypothetical protein